MIEIPTNCPCCNSLLEIINDQLYCRNSACEGQVSKKLEHFAKVMKIKGLGPKSIEKLGLESLEDIYDMDLELATERLGSAKIAEKLMEEISKSCHQPLDVVLASMSIRLVGETAAEKICSNIKHFDEITPDSLRSSGVGPATVESLVTWLELGGRQLINNLPVCKTPKLPTETTGQTICITGKLKSFKTKNEAYDYLVAKGYRVVESVTKNLDILVDETDAGNSSKRVKAEQLNIRIVQNIHSL